MNQYNSRTLPNKGNPDFYIFGLALARVRGGVIVEVKKILNSISIGLRGRLDAQQIDSALSYIAHNELPLALEILCEQIYDYDVRLLAEEKELLRKCCAERNVRIEVANRIETYEP